MREPHDAVLIHVVSDLSAAFNNCSMPNNYQHINFKIDDRVARITFARPPVNIFNIAMMREINERARPVCSTSASWWPLFLMPTSDCRAFSAGVAVEEHVEETIFQMLDSFHAIFRNLEQIGPADDRGG